MNTARFFTPSLTPSLRRAAAGLCTLLAAAVFAHEAAAAAEGAPGQSVVSALPPSQAAVTISPDESWKSAGNRTFTGEVVTKAAFRQHAPARSYGAYVRFSPGARTFWHIHPLGQTLIIIEGTGLTQAVEADGTPGAVVVLKPGDVVTCPPGVMHWHGASPESPMTHLAISEADPKQPTVWKEALDEKSYREGAARAHPAK